MSGLSRKSLISNEADGFSSIWWRNRTRGEQILAIVSTTFLLSIIIITIALISGPSRKKSGNSPICLIPGCVKAASEIIKNLDQSVSPCEDFYSFACGGWMENSVVLDHRLHLSSMATLRDYTRTQTRVLLETPPEKEDPEFMSIPKNIFISCMNISVIEKQGDSPLKEVIAKLGGWPVLNIVKWNKNQRQKKFDWIEFLNICRREGYPNDMLFGLNVISDLNGIRNVLNLDESRPILRSSRMYAQGLNHTMVAAYYKFMVESAVLLGGERETAVKEMKDVLDLETKFANFSIRNDYNASDMTVRNLNELIFQAMLGRNIEDTEIISVTNRGYIQQMGESIDKINPRTLANYMIWRVIIRSSRYMSAKWRNLWRDFATARKYFRVGQLPRWQQCLSLVSWDHIGLSTGSIYVRKHLNEESKAEATKMADELREVIIQTLDETDWMDDKTRARAMEKVRSMKLHVGYPQELLNDKKMNSVLRDLIRKKLSKTDYFMNILKLRKWKWDQTVTRIGTNVVKNDWREWGDVMIAYPYYSMRQNSVVFAAGLLQGNYYHKERPKYLNYGAFGSVAGHEITHGFDKRGSRFDKDGLEKDWWKNETETQFMAKAQCVVEQFSNFTATEGDEKIKGATTRSYNYMHGENIADAMGIKAAYFAYKKFVREKGSEAKLPGLPFDAMQLFWISAGNSRCAKLGPELLKIMKRFRHHVPLKLRVHGAFMNSKEFAEDFKCPSGSPMNPSSKCTVW